MKMVGYRQHKLGAFNRIVTSKRLPPVAKQSRRHRTSCKATGNSYDNSTAREIVNRLSFEEKNERSVQELQEEMQVLQRQIHEAHMESHKSEEKVEEALQYLEGLEEKANRIKSSYRGATVGVNRVATPKVKSRTKQKRNLKSDLTWPQELKDFWFPVEYSKNVTEDKLVSFEVFNIPLVLFRNEEGEIGCIHDQCAHRACPLSLGKVVDGCVQCPYHGWTFDNKGQLQDAPSTKIACDRISVQSYPVKEKDGFIWLWPSEKDPEETIPEFTKPPSAFREDRPFTIHAELVIDVEVEHGLLLENLLDLAHAPFTHTSTFAKGWSIPDMVKFNTSKMLGGNWEPYPIDMSFEPPCMVLSTIGLMQPGKLEHGARASSCSKHLHQLHVCLPTSKGTRLLYRMSLDFMSFMSHVPFAVNLWSSMAEQVLSEDLRLVQGQQDRLERGGDTWANPVSYDKLAIRYRRWRNALSSSDKEERQNAENALHTMSAGELLSPVDIDELV